MKSPDFQKQRTRLSLAKLHTLSTTSAAYTKPKQALSTFGIKHYAGVLYTIDGFLEKNKENVEDNWWEVLSHSSVSKHKNLITHHME
jgi:myosin heavy subunit